MKVKLALLVVAWQVLVLAFMAGQREWILRTGAPLTLRTAPIDPNDPMRGAYVRLDYEISFVPAALCRGETVKWTKDTDYRAQQRLRDRVVYAALKVNPYGIADLVSLGDTPPASGRFLRGRVVSVDASGVRVRYGIEALFMQKDAARKMEDMARKEKAGAPTDVQIAVGSSGIGVLKSYTWEPLGLTITLDRPPPRDTREQAQRWQPQPLTGVTLTLHNYGDRDLAIVDLPKGQSFRMVPNTRSGPVQYLWAREKTFSPPAPRAENIIVLKPGGTHAVHLDLTQPPWWITDTRKTDSPAIPLPSVRDGWSASFRFEYAPPGADAVRGLPHADLVRHAPLRSRAFNATGTGID